MSLLNRLYRGNTDFNFPKFYKRALIVSGFLVLVSVISFFANGLNLAIDFEGGTVWEVPSKTFETDAAEGVLGQFSMVPDRRSKRSPTQTVSESFEFRPRSRM